MVRATVSRSFPSGTKQPYGVGSQRLSLLRLPRRSAAPQKPLRADPTVTQGRRLDPRRVTALGWRSGGGFEPPPVVVRADDRIGSVSRGLVGRAASVDRVRGVGDPRTLVPARLISSVNRSPARGPIQAQRGRACAAVRLQGSGPKRTSRGCGRRGAPVRPFSSPDRAGGLSSRSVHGFILRGGFGSGFGSARQEALQVEGLLLAPQVVHRPAASRRTWKWTWPCRATRSSSRWRSFAYPAADSMTSRSGAAVWRSAARKAT